MRKPHTIVTVLALSILFTAGVALAGKKPPTPTPTPTPTQSQLSLSYNYDATLGVTHGAVLGPKNALIASTTWNEKLPLAWNEQTGAYWVPTAFLGQLRDSALVSTHRLAPKAAQWMMTLMGAWSTTPIEDIPSDILTEIVKVTTCWCGNVNRPRGNMPWCEETCTTHTDIRKCDGCGCSQCVTYDVDLGP